MTENSAVPRRDEVMSKSRRGVVPTSSDCKKDAGPASSHGRGVGTYKAKLE